MSLPKAGIMRGVVNATHVIKGRVYVDATSDTGQTFFKCPLMIFGGDPERFAYFPATPQPTDSSRDREVLLLQGAGAQSKPWALGMKQPVGLGINDTTEDDPGVGNDHGGAVGKNDISLRNSGAYITVDSNGAVTLAPGTGAARVRIQLPDDASANFRVSRGGEADERVILANAFLDTWVNQTLYNHLVSQDARITALESQVVALSAAAKVAAVPVASVQVPVASLQAVPAFTGDGSKTPPTAGSENKSGVIDIPTKSASE